MINIYMYVHIQYTKLAIYLSLKKQARQLHKKFFEFKKGKYRDYQHAIQGSRMAGLYYTA